MVLAAEFSAQLRMISESDAARVKPFTLPGRVLPTHLQDIADLPRKGLAMPMR